MKTMQRSLSARQSLHNSYYWICIYRFRDRKASSPTPLRKRPSSGRNMTYSVRSESPSTAFNDTHNKVPFKNLYPLSRKEFKELQISVLKQLDNLPEPYDGWTSPRNNKWKLLDSKKNILDHCMSELVRQRSITCVEEGELLALLWIKVTDIINDLKVFINAQKEFVLSGVHAAQAEVDSMEDYNFQRQQMLKDKYKILLIHYKNKITELQNYYVFIVNHLSHQYRKSSEYVNQMYNIFLNINNNLQLTDESKSLYKEIINYQKTIKTNSFKIRKITDDLIYNISHIADMSVEEDGTLNIDEDCECFSEAIRCKYSELMNIVTDYQTNTMEMVKKIYKLYDQELYVKTQVANEYTRKYQEALEKIQELEEENQLLKQQKSVLNKQYEISKDDLNYWKEKYESIPPPPQTAEKYIQVIESEDYSLDKSDDESVESDSASVPPPPKPNKVVKVSLLDYINNPKYRTSQKLIGDIKLPIKQLLNLITSLFEEKITTDETAKRDETPIMTFPEFVYTYFLTKYGLTGMTDQKLHELCYTIEQTYKMSSRIRLFRQLCCIGETVDLETSQYVFYIYSFILKCARRKSINMTIMDKAPYYMLFPSTLLIEIAKNLYITVNDKTFSLKMDNHYILTVNEKIQKSILRRLEEMKMNEFKCSKRVQGHLVPVRDSVIPVEDFLLYLMQQYQLGPTDNRVDTTKLFKEVNQSKTGKITLDEFKSYMKQKFPEMRNARVTRLFNSCLAESSDITCLTPRSFESLVIKWDFMKKQDNEENKAGKNVENMTDWEYLKYQWGKTKIVVYQQLDLYERNEDDKDRYNRLNLLKNSFRSLLKDENSIKSAWQIYQSMMLMIDEELVKDSNIKIPEM